jgi:2-methylaconitate cis-trans-isomerase PrpF
MCNGSSKSVFFHADALPADPLLRDRLLLRVISRPTWSLQGKHIDGMGGATSCTGKVVILCKSNRPDADYLFGAVAVDAPRDRLVRQLRQLSAAIGPFAM